MAALLSCGIGEYAHAQPDSEYRASTLAEVTVTAEKREERELDVPISIVALTADELVKGNIQGIDDLQGHVPGLAVDSTVGLRSITIRGIGNGNGGSSLVGIYVDEASVTSQPAVQLDVRTYDLERVEVLRGPQGTLYGEGSVGGTIRFITRNPVLDRFEMNADVAALFTENGAPSQRIQSVINVPLIADQLGVRVAGTFDHEGGWIDQPAAGLRNINYQNVADARLKGLWRPTEEFNVTAMALIHRNDAVRGTGEDTSRNFTQVGGFTTTPQTEDDYNLFNLTATQYFPAVQILSSTSYLTANTDAHNIGQIFPLFGPPPALASFYADIYDTTNEEKSFSEEFRLSANNATRWQWTLGGFYRRFRVANDDFNAYGGEADLPLSFLFATYRSHNTSNSSAAFGDTSYKLTPRLTVGAGLRYFHDRQTTDDDYDALQVGTFHSLNPRAYVEYELAKDVNVYTSAAKGFRSGGFNGFGLPPYEPESVWTYELGTKLSLLDNHLSIESDVFLTNYANYIVTGLIQVPSLGYPATIQSNNGRARIKGAEAAVRWQADGWLFSLTGDYLDDRFVEVNTLVNPDGTGSAQHFVGDPLDDVPQYQFSGIVGREFHFGSGHSGLARLEYSQQGHQYYRNRNGAATSPPDSPWYYDRSDLIHMLNFNLSLDWSDSLRLGFFAQNLLNDRGFLGPDDIEKLSERARPRTFGVQFGVKFN